MTDSTNPRVMADNIKKLHAGNLGTEEKVSALQIFDDAETDTGKVWVDGKPIYRKVINAELPNSTTKTINHGITNLGDLVFFNAYSKYTEGTNRRKLGDAGSGTSSLTVSNTEIIIVTNQNLSGIYADFILEYTKADPTP